MTTILDYRLFVKIRRFRLSWKTKATVIVGHFFFQKAPSKNLTFLIFGLNSVCCDSMLTSGGSCFIPIEKRTLIM